MRELDENSSSWSVGNWHVLKDEFGIDVASAFHDGIVTYWRKYKPQLRSEGASPLQTDFHVIFGLTGLSIEAKENHNWCITLTPSETEIAFRYAMHELNGFPFWFEYFFNANIKTVSQYILTELYFELAQVRSDSDSYISYIIDDLVWSGSWAWNSVAPDLYEAISHSEPSSLRALGQILIILQGSTLDNKELEQLALTKISHLENLDNAAYWFAVFVGVNSELAIPMLEQKLLLLVESGDSTRFAMTFISRLLGGRLNRGTNTRESFRTPEYLKALYLLMHRYIKQDEDINRIGKGVYSPGLRDDAQDARNHLFSLLKEIPGKPTYLALNEISNSHPDELSRSWFKLHAKERAEADASSDPWSLIQVRDFYERQERTPNSHRELFDLAIMRLKDLKADLERGDSSEASILKTIKEEVEVRKYIGNRFRQTSQGRYSIPQEEELADAKKPDFRFHGVGFDGPVPIELKLADNWTGPQLIERLENQLCGDYLRDERSRLGVFLLIYRGEKTSWQVGEPKETLDFDQFVQYMSEYWSEISKSYPKIDDVLVIGIDLTARFR